MKNLLFVLVAVLCSSYGFSQEITGSWNGKINVQGTTLPLIFKIEKAEKGYKSTLTSPLQSPIALASTMTSFENNKLIIIPNYNSGRMRKVNISAKNGSLVELDQLTNFTNYNTPQPGGWLDKYN